LAYQLLDPTPNHSKLNEIAPVVTRSDFMQLFAPYDNSVVRVFFHASASLLRQTAYFLPLAAPTGVGIALLKLSQITIILQ
jgi:hypothetical protein